MARTIRAHFDGHSFIPDEPVALPKGCRVSLIVSIDDRVRPSLTERLAILDELALNPVRGAHIPDECLRRESMYGND